MPKTKKAEFFYGLCKKYDSLTLLGKEKKVPLRGEANYNI